MTLILKRLLICLILPTSVLAADVAPGGGEELKAQGATPTSRVQRNYGFLYKNTFNYDDFDDDLDGISFGGTVELQNNLLLDLSYMTADVGDVDVSGYYLAFGVALPVSEATDVQVRVGYLSLKVEAAGASQSETETGLELELVSRASEVAQIHLMLSSYEGETSHGFKVDLFFAPRAAISLGISGNKYGSGTSIGVLIF